MGKTEAKISEYKKPYNLTESVKSSNYPAGMFSRSWMFGLNEADYTFQFITRPGSNQNDKF